MQLTAFRIYRYRSIVDSGWIEVNPLTVLVGKNESGKTTVLQALHKFNPFHPEPYSLDREWPRAQRRTRSEDQVVCATRFSLSEEESAELSRLTEGKCAATEFEVTRDYKGRVEVSFPDGLFAAKLHPNAVDAACDALPRVAEPVGDAFRDRARRCAEEVCRLAGEGRFTELSALPEGHASALAACFNPWNPEPSYENEEEYVRRYVGRMDAVTAALAALPAMQRAAHEYIVKRLPTFLFMDEYRAFRGSAALDEVYQRKQNSKLTGEDRTLEMILELAGLSLESEVKKVQEVDREQRQYDLDDAAAALTSAIEGRWKQLKYEVKFAADGHQFFTFVKDQKDGALIKLEERSRGFQWFFSFDLMLMYESQGSFKNCVILLDEPGLALHPAAQRDLLARLEQYAGANTLLYTTHLPFMIDLRQPERIRVLSETKEGTRVTSELTGAQPEAKFTLDAALGIDGSSSFLLSARNLLVEGADDYWILCELSSLFIRSGLEGLPEDVLVAPTPSAVEAASVATLMVGRNLDVVVLLCSPETDGPSNGLMKKWVSRYNPTVAAEVLSMGGISGDPEREFGAEDLFPEEFYLDIVKRIYKKDLAAAGLKKIDTRGSGRLAKRVEQALAAAGIAFNARLVATALRSSIGRMRSTDELPPETRKHTEKVIKAIGEVFGKEKHFWTRPA